MRRWGTSRRCCRNGRPRLVRAGLLTVLFCAGTSIGVAASEAADPRCSDPVQDASFTTPSVEDCVFILRAAVGDGVCDPECICDPGFKEGITVEDALVCLRRSVGLNVALDCRCPWETTYVEDLSSSPVLHYRQHPWYQFCPLDDIASASIEPNGDGTLQLRMTLLNDATRCFSDCFESDYGFDCGWTVPDEWSDCPCIAPGPVRQLSDEEAAEFRNLLRRFELDEAVEPYPWCGYADPPYGYRLDVGRYAFLYPTCESPQLAFRQLGRILDLLERLRDAS